VGVLAVAVGCLMATGRTVGAAQAGAPALLARALAGPLRGVDEIVFCTRSRYDDPHWYANIGYYCDDQQHKAYAGNGRPDDGKLFKFNLRTGAVTLLLDARGGSVRDPQVSYDGRKILFSYRPAGTDFFHLYEIDVEGRGLKPLTAGEFDDYEPTYLPDGDLAFVSTRCRRWVNCWMTQVGVIHRCDAQGANIHAISANTEHDNTPWVMPEGRILYTRWEYVDRSQVEFHHLWTMNPDGTGQSVFYGNLHPGIVMIDAKPIPGTQQVVASFSPGHGVNEHAGVATIVWPQRGPDDLSVPRAIHQGRLTRDPYPLSADCFLLAREKQIVLMDAGGREQVLYAHSGAGGVHEPRPVMARPREPVVAPHGDPREAVGRMILADVYHGRNLPGVNRGDVKKLLVLESLPKQVNFSGGQDLTSWGGTFTLERVLGVVPVEEDGSAFFELPAHRQVFFVALDGQDLSVKRMQSWSSVRPGETLGCVGCHEHRTETPRNPAAGGLAALRRPPSPIQAFAGFPDVLDFTRDIQPILDRRCVECHNYARREGKVLLTGDLGPSFSHAYFSLFAYRQVADGRNGLGDQPPRSIGSAASPLLKKVDGSHYGVNASPQERQTLWLWIESGAPYAGSYAGLRNAAQQNDSLAAVAAVFQQKRDVLTRRCGSCHQDTRVRAANAKPLPITATIYEFPDRNRARRQPHGAFERIILENDPAARFSAEILLNFSRPECSPLVLGPLAKAAGGFETCGDVFRDRHDADYRQLLAAIEQGKERLGAEPRFGRPGFRPNSQYVREMKRYGIFPARFDPATDAVDVFQADQRYWQSLWKNPEN
jgi:hypothetical protein